MKTLYVIVFTKTGEILTPEAFKQFWKKALQLAAMSFRFLLSLEKYEYIPGKQHEQNI